MNNKSISRGATIAFAIIIGIIGIKHFISPDFIAVRTPFFLPDQKTLTYLIYIVGGCLLLAAIAFITGLKIRLAGYLLAILFVIFALTVHLPLYFSGGFNNPELAFATFMNIFKDLGLACCSLLIATRE